MRGLRKGRRPKRNGVATNTSKSLSLFPFLLLRYLRFSVSTLYIYLSLSVSLRVNIRPGIARPRPYVCSLSSAPNSCVASEIGNKRKPNSVISDSVGRRTAAILLRFLADFVPWKSIAFAVTPEKNRDLLKAPALQESTG